MGEFDRLSAMMQRFTLSVTPHDPRHQGLWTGVGLFLLPAAADGAGYEVVLCTDPDRPLLPDPDRPALFAASIDWGGPGSPLASALPALTRVQTAGDAELHGLVGLLLAEQRARRCGGLSVLARMAEVVVVRLLRHLIEEGAVRSGLLAGLGDPRLSRAIVALHEAPGRAWTLADMADVAGLSVSRFAEVFRLKVGTTPLAYLRGWRLGLARQDIETGARLEGVARRYGYGSPEALTHALRRATGRTPRSLRAARNPAAGQGRSMRP